VDDRYQHHRADNRHREVADAAVGGRTDEAENPPADHRPDQSNDDVGDDAEPEPRITRPAIQPAIIPRKMLPSILKSATRCVMDLRARESEVLQLLG